MVGGGLQVKMNFFQGPLPGRMDPIKPLFQPTLELPNDHFDFTLLHHVLYCRAAF